MLHVWLAKSITAWQKFCGRTVRHHHAVKWGQSFFSAVLCRKLL
ncbi:hypothetical protein CAter282_3648 [Collimonas arenae]|uniref:Uncharacterized protein n=1 Tax=Collimonas arenae TaxID=279058 RepID=A0A127QMP2_9BURK|nr:hypothetical protein CAter282_3648 [Collimonas arenae]